MRNFLFKGSIGLLLIAGLLLLTPFDLTISERLVNQGSQFGMVFREIGEFPIAVFPAMFATVCFFAYPRLRALALIALPIFNYIWLEMVFAFSDLEGASQTIFLVTMALVISALALLGCWRVPEPIRNKMVLPLLFSVIMIAACTLSVNVIKILWGRVRFVNLIETTDFTPWYSPTGINGHKSFPSGHTQAACAMLSVFLFIEHFKMPKIAAILLSVLAIALIFCTALSRVILGAHYSTDVAFTIILCYFALLLSMHLMKKARE